MRKVLMVGVVLPMSLAAYGACSGDNNNGDGGADATQDVVPDKKLPPETGTDATAFCTPVAVTSTDIVWTPPHAPNPTGCSDVQLKDYFNFCFGAVDAGASKANCTAWKTNAANATCYTCMFSTEGVDSGFGALISTGIAIYANIGGCIAIEQNDQSATSCGAKYWAANDCEDLSCKTNCPVGDAGVTFADYQACTQLAVSGTCKDYENALCDLSDAGTLVADCLRPYGKAQPNFGDYVTSLGVVFCGGYATDGGVNDAAADAPDGD